MRIRTAFSFAGLALAACSSSVSSETSGTTGTSGAVCADGEVTSPETCDDGNAVTEVCAYGEASCEVCNSACQLAPGATSLCGDGVIDGAAGETCDDGGSETEICAYGEQACEVCDATCHRASGQASFCGDGAIDSDAGESCDDGNAVVGACAYGESGCLVCGPDCEPVAGVLLFCGDGVVDPFHGEACDDGNSVDGDGCDTTCTPSGCGNGVVSGAELCDDGNLVDGDGCDASCQPTGCGSGIVTGSEQCDDGNLVDGDGCDSNCTPTSCGNGIVVPGETCDDGNTVTEACPYGMTSCTVCNAACQSAPGAATYCGDGALDTTQGEDCEDGNNVDGDGCESDCHFACGLGSGADAAYLESTGCSVYFGTKATWDAAQATCAGIGFSLVTVRSPVENLALSQKQHGQSNLWIGLNDQAVEGAFVWDSGLAATYFNWSGNEPNDSGGNENCAAMTATSAWNDAACSSAYAFVCEQRTCGDGVLDPNEACDDGNLVDGDGCDSSCKVTGCGSGVVTGAEECDDGNLIDGDGCESTCTFACGSGSGADAARVFGGHCYLRFNTPASWDAAEAACVGLAGHLVSIEDAAENAFIQSFLSSNALIGLTDVAVEGTFMWLSGSALTYTNWNNNEPNNAGGNEDCAEMRVSDGRWNDVKCANPQTSICEL